MAHKKLETLRWTPELAAQFWQDLAGTEFLADIAFSRFASPLLVELTKPFLGDKILDYGGGANLYLVRELLRHGYNVGYFEPHVADLGTDDNLQFAANFLGRTTQIGTEEYDSVFLSEVIEHLFDDDLTRVINEVRAGLKKGGTLIVTTPCDENIHMASRYCPTCHHLFHPWGHVRSFSPSVLENLLSDCGFRCEALHNVDFSDTRDPIEKYKHLRRRVMKMISDIAHLCQTSRLDSDVKRTLANHIENFHDLLNSESEEDTQHQHIGYGGTLVAVARKL